MRTSQHWTRTSSELDCRRDRQDCSARFTCCAILTSRMTTPKHGHSGPQTRILLRGKAPSGMACPMLRGEIWQVDLDPARGSEANKRRPAVIVSNDRANAAATRLGRGVVTVVPVTSNVDTIYPFQVLLSAATSGLDVDSKAQAEQVRSVATQRLLRRLGQVSPTELSTLDDALRLHLAL